LPPEVMQLYGGLEIIYEVHRFLLVALKQNMAIFDVKTGAFGSIFLNEVQNFVVYERYLNNFRQAMDLIISQRQNDPKFKEYLEKNECTKKTRGLDLASILIQPVQRLPRYIMLLQEYLKYTSPNNTDYQEAELSVTKLKQMLNAFNESKRKSINQEAQQKIIHSVSGVDFMSFNAETEYIMEGELMLRHRVISDDKVYFYLFKDMIIFAKTDHAGTVTRSISKLFNSKLYAFKLENVIKSKDLRKVAEDADSDCAFTLVTKSKEYKLVAPNEKKKSDWVRQITKLIPSNDTQSG